jgi:hypothetical protein
MYLGGMILVCSLEMVVQIDVSTKKIKVIEGSYKDIESFVKDHKMEDFKISFSGEDSLPTWHRRVFWY